MAKSSDKSKGRFGAEVMILVFGLGLLWFLIRRVEYESLVRIFEPYLFYILVFIGVVLLFWMGVLTCRFYFYVRRYKKMATVEIELSRDDTTEPFEMYKYFDNVFGLLCTKFAWVGFFTGHSHVVWELGRRDSMFYIRISAPKDDLDSVTKSLQAVYQNVRFKEVPNHVLKKVPNEILQMRLQRNWFYPLQSLKNYQKSIVESVFAVLDEVSEDATLQVVMVPMSRRFQRYAVKKQKKFEVKHSKSGDLGKVEQKSLSAAFENQGKAFFLVEVRLYSDSKKVLKGIIGSLGESSQQNNLIPELYLNYLVRLIIKKIWWKYWVQGKMPSIILGPKLKLSSFSLSTILQLPTMRLRVSGLKRSSQRRIPVPVGVPSNKDEAFMMAENGQYISMPDDERYVNMLISGMQGSGKSTLLRSYSAPVLRDPGQSAVIVTPDRSDAEAFLEYIPTSKKVYIIDLSRPGDYGLNALADDSVSADTLAGNLLSTFRTTYGKEAVGDQSADLLVQSFKALRLVRTHERWKVAIPIIDFRHMRDMISDDDFRECVVADLPEGTTSYQYWTKQFPKLVSKGNYSKILPILNKFNSLLQSERIEKILCHPSPISLRRVIRERAVFILYTAKHEVGEEFANLFANMLMSQVFQSISSQVGIPEEDRVPVNLFLDEIHGYANQSLLVLLQEARKYGARTAGATLSLSSIPYELRDPFNNLFGHKVIFRTNDMKEADTWSKTFAQLYSNFISLRDEDQDRLRVGTDDILNLKRYHAVAKLTFGGQPLDAFIAMTIPNDRGKKEWKNAHPWPQAKDVEILPVRTPDVSRKSEEDKKQEDDYKAENRSISLSYPSVPGVSSSRIEKIIEELGISQEVVKEWLDEAVEEIQSKKMRRGIAVFLENFLREKKKLDQ